ncbi:hypothetical protein BB561_003428 [Smittium simulii]|uniref:Aspartic peptidase DDI1-type domain-containing protein n=1 Tax=Smittium simulii TaxID=133385 RepID=A0A2T9YLI5_9FUNG|nr:hypothetical protein BB561_003428 [Smittium simulii]
MGHGEHISKLNSRYRRSLGKNCTISNAQTYTEVMKEAERLVKLKNKHKYFNVKTAGQVKNPEKVLISQAESVKMGTPIQTKAKSFAKIVEQKGISLLNAELNQNPTNNQSKVGIIKICKETGDTTKIAAAANKRMRLETILGEDYTPKVATNNYSSNNGTGSNIRALDDKNTEDEPEPVIYILLEAENRILPVFLDIGAANYIINRSLVNDMSLPKFKPKTPFRYSQPVGHHS